MAEGFALTMDDDGLPEPPSVAPDLLPKTRQVVRRPMTSNEAAAARCIWTQVTFPVGHWDKKFMRGLPDEITEKQAAQVWRIFKTYRRQITHERKAEMLEMAAAACAAMTKPE